MNCLTEALGLSQPGNGSLLATHADRKELFLNAGKRIVELTKRYYEQDDASALPRNIASKAAFENAMTLDIAMGGSTNTVLHLLAAAQEAEIDFTMSDIDKLSAKCRSCVRWRRARRNTIWKMCIAPAACWAFWASWTAPGC